MGANLRDILTRGILRAAPRRALLHALSGIGLASLAAHDQTDARKRKRKKKKKKCTRGGSRCGKSCFDLQTDPLHCGKCGNRCDDDLECRGGQCLCPEDATECGDACCDSGEICLDGHCEEDLCPPQFTYPDGQFCAGGECVCPDGQTVCEDACCEAGLSCVSGQCEDLCPPELICPDGQACLEGDCTCPEAACAVANDPTNDEFELCSCEKTVEGARACFASIPCTPNPPTCTSSAECGAGAACQALSCGGIARCGPLCPLS